VNNNEVTTPLYLVHSKPVDSELLQQISKLIQEGKVTFEPAYTIAPDGTMTIRHISIRPRYSKCKPDEQDIK
jgi:hypothetical protein